MPKVSLEGTYQRVDSVPKVSFGDTDINLGSLDNRSADLVLVQPIDVFGAINTARRTARSSRSISEHEYDRQRNDTILDTKLAFYSVLRAQKFLKVQEDTIAQLEAHVKDAETHYAAGTIAKFDVLRAETQLANARQGLIAAQNGVELAKAAFNNVLGRTYGYACRPCRTGVSTDSSNSISMRVSNRLMNGVRRYCKPRRSWTPTRAWPRVAEAKRKTQVLPSLGL
jgi:outer membrane protein TolC